MGCAKSARSGVCSGWAAITTLGNGSIMGEITSSAISVRSGHTTLPFHVWSLWWYIGRSCQCCPFSLTPLFLSITTIAVGFGDNYPTQVHHRGASIPDDHHKYQCKEGWRWRDSSEPNLNVIIGAMVVGPDSHDGFSDKRRNPNYTEPALIGNAGVASALAALSATSTGLDRNTIFSRLLPPSVDSPPPQVLGNPA